ncbi:hypothetical protein DRW03_07960 [Corallococcus sp. H22C18031201]|uniref:hypothetical protein n=1 Tax=Citreicoccus inhibens TaxID=2849499 RepID=UPI000E75BE20|nr:hypothetical protein [Citreicoccus inhibens]MBU8900399.1 hypothetical protein [Citreicoccus inhibens]RJS25049.1 hypothetical protein DRW03_07960 [Corallococcus sp. H22C18031201]
MTFKRFLTAAALLVTGTSQAVEPPWGKEENLGQRMALEATSLCTDGKGHYVAIAPMSEEGKYDFQLYYGDGKQFVEVAPPEGYTSATTFLEPRFFNKGANPNFRGMDMRVYSSVDLKAKEQKCSLRCGDREVPLKWVAGEQARELLRKAAFAPNPQKYVPYALLRDTQGNYYFVDRGFLPSEAKSFRVFIGPRGDLKPQKMTNVVSDSEGEIFSTKKGELRLVLDKQKSPVWIASSKKTLELRVVPVEENLPLVYNELGVYTGVRLGTPCDDQ